MKKLLMLSCAVIMNVSALNTTARAMLTHEQDYQIPGAYLKAKIAEAEEQGVDIEAFRSDVLDEDGDRVLFGIRFTTIANGVLGVDLPYAVGRQRCQAFPDQQMFLARWWADEDQNPGNLPLWGQWLIVDDLLQGCGILIDPQW